MKTIRKISNRQLNKLQDRLTHKHQVYWRSPNCIQCKMMVRIAVERLARIAEGKRA